MMVDVPNKKYSVTISEAGMPPVKIATDYAFRTAQKSVAALDTLAFIGVGEYTHMISNIKVSAGFPQAPTAPIGLQVFFSE
jgi:hypothetical protein